MEKNKYGSVHNVSEIRVHEQFNANTTDFDFALLKLSDKIEFNDKAKPVVVQERNPRKGTLVVIAGWGATKFDGSNSNYLHSTEINIKDHEQCGKAYGNKITERMICASYPGRDSCQVMNNPQFKGNPF
jgi:hypothetical protein